jgi:histidinol-phosphate aminotransferase
MGNTLARREWIKQVAVATGGLTITPHLFANNESGYRSQAIIRLHANENPYGPSPLARKAMADAVSSSNFYPWEVTTTLREKIASIYGLTKEHVLIGAGSSEILGLVAQHAALKEGNAVTADPTFSIWFTSAQRSGLKLIKVPLNSAKQHDLDSMKQKVNDQTRLVYICNPNNPTGTVLPVNELKQFIGEVSARTLVLLDEAYTEYSDQPSLGALVSDNPNLVIARTFSKVYGLAGARIGYALAHAGLIQQLNELQPWANSGASAVSLAGAMASLDDTAFVKMSKQKNAEVRSYVINAFGELNVPAILSHTNFVYYSLEKQKGDLLGSFAGANIRGGRITEENGKWSRISIGTQDDMSKFIALVKKAF